jgi:hypothetical protein
MTTFASYDLAAEHHRDLVAAAEHRRSVRNARATARSRQSPARAARAFRAWLEAGQL